MKFEIGTIAEFHYKIIDLVILVSQKKTSSIFNVNNLFLNKIMSRQNRNLNYLAFAEYDAIDPITNTSVSKKIFDIRNNRFLYTVNNWICKLAILDSNYTYQKRGSSGGRSRPEYIEGLKCPIYRQYPVIWASLKSMDIMEPCDNSEIPTEINYETDQEGRHLHFEDSRYRKKLLANASFAIMLSSLKLQYDTTKQFSVFFDDPDKLELKNMFSGEPSL
jgi:hypothetical protein